MDVIFSSVSAPFFAQYLADITNKKFVKWQELRNRKFRKCHLFLVGLYFPEHRIYTQLSHFKSIVILFAGSDLLKLNDLNSHKRNAIFNRLKKHGAVFATESPEIQSRIKDIYNLDTEVVYLPSKHKFSKTPLPMPDKFSIGCYMPDTLKKKFYGYKTVIQVVKKLEDVDFHFYSLVGYSANKDEKRMKNLKCHKSSVSDMRNFLGSISCGLRLTDHDTYSMSAIDYVMSGRWFINNHIMPYCDKISLHANVDEIVAVINDIRDRGGWNMKGLESYQNKHDVKVFYKRIKSILR